jgi:hypothetical protein
MEIFIHEKNGIKNVEITADEIIISKVQDALDLVVKPELSGARNIVLHQKNIDPIFFDLSSKLAGEILQKFVNYQIRLAIVGDFKNITSKSLHDFTVECNRGNDFFFVESLDEALEKL